MISWQQPIKQQRLVVCRFWRWQLESSHLWLAGFQNRSETRAGWTTVPAHAEKKAKRGNHRANAAVALQRRGQNTKRLPKRRKRYLLAGEPALTGPRVPMGCAGEPARYGGRCRLDRGKPILCDSYVTSVPHASLHLITLVDTRAKTEHVNGWGREEDEWLCKPRLPNWHAALQQGLEKSFAARVPRINKKNIYAVQLLTRIALTRLAENGAGHQGLSPGTKKKMGSQKPPDLTKPVCFHTNVRRKATKNG